VVGDRILCHRRYPHPPRPSLPQVPTHCGLSEPSALAASGFRIRFDNGRSVLRVTIGIRISPGGWTNALCACETSCFSFSDRFLNSPIVFRGMVALVGAANTRPRAERLCRAAFLAARVGFKFAAYDTRPDDGGRPRSSFFCPLFSPVTSSHSFTATTKTAASRANHQLIGACACCAGQHVLFGDLHRIRICSKPGKTLRPEHRLQPCKTFRIFASVSLAGMTCCRLAPMPTTRFRVRRTPTILGLVRRSKAGLISRWSSHCGSANIVRERIRLSPGQSLVNATTIPAKTSLHG